MSSGRSILNPCCRLTSMAVSYAFTIRVPIFVSLSSVTLVPGGGSSSSIVPPWSKDFVLVVHEVGPLNVRCSEENGDQHHEQHSPEELSAGNDISTEEEDGARPCQIRVKSDVL